MRKHVPHEIVKTWPVGKGLGLKVVVEPGITDAQLSELVRTYERNGAVVIFVYDSASTVNH